MAYEAANKRFGPGEKPKSHITGTAVYRKICIQKNLDTPARLHRNRGTKENIHILKVHTAYKE